MSDYDTDTVLWSAQQADLLRRLAAGERVNDQVDWANVAEEIDSVGRSQRLALASYVGLVLQQLMKLEASPAMEPRHGWEETVRRTQLDIERLLEANPSLRRTVGAVVARQLPAVRGLVAASLARYGETPRVAMEGLSFDAEAVLGGFFPTEPGNAA